MASLYTPISTHQHLTPMAPASARSILIIESDPDRGQTLATTLAPMASAPVIAVSTHDQALDVLRRQPHPQDCPNLILLSLNPADDGQISILEAIKSDSRLKRIPVILLAASEVPIDILRCYELQGNCYIIRPASAARLTKTIEQIESFWLNTVTLPEVANR